MGFFDFLFKKQASSGKQSVKPKTTAKAKKPLNNDILLSSSGLEVDLTKRFVTRYQDTTGHAIYSPDKNYQAFWGADKGIIIFKNKLEIAHIGLKRHDTCLIANNGTLVVNGFDDSGNVFYAFDREGNVIISKHFQTALHVNGLSPDGRYAICQTVHSREKTSDQSLLTAFDLTERRELFCIKNPKKLWSAHYVFDDEFHCVHLFHFSEHHATYALNDGSPMTIPDEKLKLLIQGQEKQYKREPVLSKEQLKKLDEEARQRSEEWHKNHKNKR